MEVLICKICNKPLYVIPEDRQFIIGHAIEHALAIIKEHIKIHNQNINKLDDGDYLEDYNT